MTTEEITPFEPYVLTVGGKVYTVLEPSEPTAHRVQEPSGQVVGVPCSDSADTLTAAALAAHLANPPAPVAPVPQTVTRRQLFLALLAHDAQLTRANLRAMITDEAGLIEFDEAMEFRIDHPLVVELSVALGIDKAEIFRAAVLL